MSKGSSVAATSHRGGSRKRKIAIATAAMSCLGGAAFAYWTSIGSGSGTGASAAGVQAVSVVQTSTVTGVAPGSGAHALSGTFNNPNEAPVHIASLSATVTPVDADDQPIAGCTSSDYTIAGSPLTINQQVAGDDTTTWSGISVAFNNTSANQDACKGARLKFSYTAN